MAGLCQATPRAQIKEAFCLEALTSRVESCCHPEIELWPLSCPTPKEVSSLAATLEASSLLGTPKLHASFRVSSLTATPILSLGFPMWSQE